MNHTHSDSAAAYCLRGAVASMAPALERIQAAAEPGHMLFPVSACADASLTSPAAASAAVGAFRG